MSDPLDYLLKALRAPIRALPEGRCLLATLESDGTRRLKATLQTVPDVCTRSGMEAMAVKTIRSGPLAALAASEETSTLVLTPALAVLSDSDGDALRRRGDAAHPGPSFVGCLPGTTLDWAPPATMAAIRRLARAAARGLDEGTWDLARPLSAHQRLALGALPQAGFNALSRLVAIVGGHARVRLLVKDRAAAIIFQSLPASGLLARRTPSAGTGHGIATLLPGPSHVLAAVAEAAR